MKRRLALLSLAALLGLGFAGGSSLYAADAPSGPKCGCKACCCACKDGKESCKCNGKCTVENGKMSCKCH